MNSKVFVVLALLSVVGFVISSAAAVETSKDEQNLDVEEEAREVGDAKAGNRYCYHGCCYYGSYGCQRCCKDAAEARLMANQKQEKSNPVNEEKYGGWGGRGGGGRCCGPNKDSKTASEATPKNVNHVEDSNPVNEEKHWGGYGGYGGGWGGRGGRGGGRCCGKEKASAPKP